MSNLSSLYKSIEKIMWTDTGLNGDAQRIEQFAWMLFFKIFSDKDKELEVMDDAYQSPIPEQYRWDEWAGNDEGMTGDELLHFIDRDLFPALRNLDLSSGNRRALIVREVFEGNNNYMKSGINLRKVLNKLNEIDFNRAKDRHAFGDIYEGILKGLQSAGKSGEFYTPRAVTQFICDTLAPRLGESVLDPACGTGGFLTAAVETLKAQAKTVADQQQLQKVKGWEYKPLPFLLATTNLILHDVEVPNITFRDVLDQPLSTYSQKDRVDVVLANPPFGGVVANGNETNFPAAFRTKESADLFLVLIMHLLKDGGRAGVVLPDGSLTGKDVKQRVRQKLLEECNLHTIVRLPNSIFQPYATISTNLLFFTKGAPTKEIWYYEHRLPEGQKSYSKTKAIRREEFQAIEAWWNNREESEVAWRVPIQTIIERGYNLDIKNPHQINTDNSQPSEALRDLETEDDTVVNLINKLAAAIDDIVPEKLFFVENLNKIALAPDGIKEIKRTLVGLAVQGRLLPQDSNDEPAVVLLHKSQTSVAKLDKKGSREPRVSSSEETSIKEGPFQLPGSWVWTTLGEVASKIGSGSTPKAGYTKEGVPFFRSQNIYEEGLELSDIVYISNEVHRSMRGTNVQKNDVLLNITGGSLGRATLIIELPSGGNVSQHVCIVRSTILNSEFLHKLILSPYFQELIFASTSGAGRQGLPKYNLERFLIPIPPLAEQDRIVAKLGQLFQLCDVLERHICESRRLTKQLLVTALREALSPPPIATPPVAAELELTKATQAPARHPSRRSTQLTLSTLFK